MSTRAMKEIGRLQGSLVLLGISNGSNRSHEHTAYCLFMPMLLVSQSVSDKNVQLNRCGLVRLASVGIQ